MCGTAAVIFDLQNASGQESVYEVEYETGDHLFCDRIYADIAGIVCFFCDPSDSDEYGCTADGNRHWRACL